MGNMQFFKVVPQQTAYVVEFLGKYQKTLTPGFHFLIPVLHNAKYKHSLKEELLQIHEQEAVTKDNVHIHIDGVLYLRVDDPVKASYGAEDPLNFCYTLAQSIMRAEIGKLTLDNTFQEREFLNQEILQQISSASENWGVKCLRYEIKDIIMDENFKHILNLQANSERVKEAEILGSLGEKQSMINIAEGNKQKVILEAEGEAQNIYLHSKAIAERLRLVIESIPEGDEESANSALKLNLTESLINSLSFLGRVDKQIIIKKALNNPNKLLEELEHHSSLESMTKKIMPNNKD
jgi:regulator of protease activity HflC (stomatin/prohibitin superfamily)